jgi:hypothetical protein
MRSRRDSYDSVQRVPVDSGLERQEPVGMRASRLMPRGRGLPCESSAFHGKSPGRAGLFCTSDSEHGGGGGEGVLLLSTRVV